MGRVGSVAVSASNKSWAPVKTAAWLAVAALALAAGAATGLGWKPLITARNPVSPSFELGPLAGSITQSIAFPGGPLDTLTIWTRRAGGPAAYVEIHLLPGEGGSPLRSARLEAPASAELRAVPIALAPVDLPAGPLALRVVAPEQSLADLYVGATGNDAYPGGRLVDHLGQAPVDVDLAFSANGHAGALTRIRTQATESPFYVAIGLAIAWLAGAVIGSGAWSSLCTERFGRPAVVAVVGGVFAAIAIALMHGPAAVI